MSDEERIAVLEEKVAAYDKLIAKIVTVMSGHPVGRAMLKKLEDK